MFKLNVLLLFLFLFSHSLDTNFCLLFIVFIFRQESLEKERIMRETAENELRNLSKDINREYPQSFYPSANRYCIHFYLFIFFST